MADYQKMSSEQLNRVNGSSSALGEGSFKRRDELRRAESSQRMKIKMNERLDRNINRAVRNGDAGAATAFNNLRSSISGQGYQGTGGITNHGDREERVAEGTLMGAKARYDIGKEMNGQGAIAGSPPVDSVTPKNRDVPIDGPQGAQGGVQTGPVAPSSQMTPEALKQRQAYAADLDRSELVKTDPAARERAYVRGESIGVSRDLVDKRMNWSQKKNDFTYKAPEGQALQSIGTDTDNFESLTKPSGKAEGIDFSFNAGKSSAPIDGLGASPQSDFESLTKVGTLAQQNKPTSLPSPISSDDGGIIKSAGKLAGGSLGVAKKYYGGVFRNASKVAGKSADIVSGYYGTVWNGGINSGAAFLDEAIKAYNGPAKESLPR